MNLIREIVIESNLIPGAPTHSPQLVDLTLQEIVAAGRITNPYQRYVLGKVACFFKNGLKSVDLDMENPISFEDGSTSSVVKEAIAGLSDAECVQLARYLLDCINAGECMLHNEHSDIGSWVSFVLAKQD